MLAPNALALLRVVEPLAAVMQQHMQGDVLAHADGEVGIDDAHDRHIEQSGIRQNVIDAGAKRKDHPEPRELAEQTVRRLPNARVHDFGGIAEALGPNPEIACRGKRLEPSLPGFRIDSGDGKQDRVHQADADAPCAMSASRLRLSASHCSATISGPLRTLPAPSAASAVSMATRLSAISSCSAAAPPRRGMREASTMPRNSVICSS